MDGNIVILVGILCCTFLVALGIFLYFRGAPSLSSRRKQPSPAMTPEGGRVAVPVGGRSEQLEDNCTFESAEFSRNTEECLMLGFNGLHRLHSH